MDKLIKAVTELVLSQDYPQWCNDGLVVVDAEKMKAVEEALAEIENQKG